jgi:hypothetical protein
MPDHSLPYEKRRDANRWGAVDRAGNLVVPLKFAYLSYSSGGYLYAKEEAPFKADGSPRQTSEGFVRANGTLLADRYFDAIDRGSENRLPRGRIGKTWYSIEPNGRLIRDQLEESPLFECPGGLTVIQYGDAIEFRRPDGTAIGRFDSEDFLGRTCSDQFSVKRAGKWFVVLKDGTVLGGKGGFDNIYTPGKDHMAVQVDGKWGVIDLSGKFTVAPQFAKLGPSSDDRFIVGEGDGAYWINASGVRIAKPVMNEIPRRTLACGSGLRFFQQAGLWGLQKDSGETVIAPRYRALSCFAEGVTWTAAPGGNGWCPVGPDGQRNQALECRETFYPISLTEHFPETFSGDPYENSVLWNRAWLDYQAGNREKAPRWISRYENVGAYTVMPGPALGRPIGAFAFLRPGNLPPLAAAICLFSAAGAYGWRRKTRRDKDDRTTG